MKPQGVANQDPSAIKRYTESNRQAWNEVMPLHRKAAKAKWDSAFAQPGFVCLRPREVELLTRIGVKGKSVAHLCCNNGIELMSLKNLGAATCVGFDISDEAIKDAKELAQRCSIDCRFVRTDVYDITPDYDDLFDMVYLTTGGLGWLPDLKRFFARAAALLHPSGVVFIHDIHPFFEMLPDDGAATGDPLRIAGPYFKPEPYVDYGGLDYVGGAQYAGLAAQYWFVHTLSDILMGLITNQLCIERFSEYPESVSPQQRPVERRNAGVPLSYMLVAGTHSRS